MNLENIIINRKETTLIGYVDLFRFSKIINMQLKSGMDNEKAKKFKDAITLSIVYLSCTFIIIRPKEYKSYDDFKFQCLSGIDNLNLFYGFWISNYFNSLPQAQKNQIMNTHCIMNIISSGYSKKDIMEMEVLML